MLDARREERVKHDAPETHLYIALQLRIGEVLLLIIKRQVLKPCGALCGPVAELRYSTYQLTHSCTT